MSSLAVVALVVFVLGADAGVELVWCRCCCCCCLVVWLVVVVVVVLIVLAVCALALVVVGAAAGWWRVGAVLLHGHWHC